MIAKSSQALKFAPTLIQWGLLVIVAVMPFHAFLSVYLGSLIGHQSLIQAWKDVIIMALTALASLMLIIKPAFRQQLRHPVNLAVVGFILISLIVSLTSYNLSTRQFWLGAKTDLEFLFLFELAQLALTPKLEKRLLWVILASSSLVAGFAALQASLLDKNFLTHFGFSVHTLAPYQLIDPALPHTIRIIGTLAGPNQLGSFLVLPICLMVFLLIRRRRLILLLPLALSVYALVHSYSRSAWIGTGLAVAVIIAASLPRKLFLAIGLSTLFCLTVLAWQKTALLKINPDLQYIFLHSQITGSPYQTSNEGHASSLKQGLTAITSHPGGLGLGSAGPASFQSRAPLITENFYLQVGIETGLAGLAIFLAINILLGQALFATRSLSILAIPCLAALVGLAVSNLFLHTWTDSSTALIFWGTAGATLGITKAKYHAKN